MVEILECGHEPTTIAGPGTGYGKDENGNRYCYECCATRDREQMLRDGRTVLYLSEGKVTNWPGTLEFKTGYVKTGRHNIAGVRYDVWFTGPEGTHWHGVQYGDNTQLLHCRKVKAA